MFDPDPGFDLRVPIPDPSKECVAGPAVASGDTAFQAALDAGYFEHVGALVPS